jgi:mono/diheme cytochrome c family protein
MRRPTIGRVLAAAAVALVAAQLFPIARSNPPVSADVAAPPEVAALLRRACYDCHSNETVWPWYSRVAPISWLVAHDVRHGREELNFSVWDTYDPAKRRKKLTETVKEVVEGEMPPWSYVLVHPDARLRAADHERLRAWVRY